MILHRGLCGNNNKNKETDLGVYVCKFSILEVNDISSDLGRSRMYLLPWVLSQFCGVLNNVCFFCPFLCMSVSFFKPSRSEASDAASAAGLEENPAGT